MKNRIIQVAAVVPELKLGDVDYNTEQMISLIRELPDCGIIVFPELSVTGYTCADLFLSDLLLIRSEEALVKLAHETESTGNLVVTGAPVRFRNCLYNCAAILSCGRIKALIRVEGEIICPTRVGQF